MSPRRSSKTYYEPARWHDLRDFSGLHDVDFFRRMAGKCGPRVLECAVGSGRISIPLALDGYDVWGIDRDEGMLERAAGKWAPLKDGAKGSLRLEQADIIDFRLRKRFDMAFIAFNTFLTLSVLEQRLAALRCVRRHLATDGRFIIDIYQPNYSRLASDQPEHRDFTIEDPEIGGVVTRYSWDRRDMSNQHVQMSFEYRWRDPDGHSRAETLSFPMCVIFPVEMRLLLQLAGFEVERIYGDHDASPFDKNSPRMIFLARKVSMRRR